MNFGVNLEVCTGYAVRDASGVPYRFIDSVDPLYRYPDMQGFKYPDKTDGWYLRNQDFYLRVLKTVYQFKIGFDYDGASIPKAFWTVVGHPLLLDYLVEALWHDMAYSTHFCTRTIADDTFLSLMQCTGMNNWARRNAMWSAVRLGGGRMYPKTAEELKKYYQYYDMFEIGKQGILINVKPSMEMIDVKAA